MRRLVPLFASLLSVSVACTKPPKPEADPKASAKAGDKKSDAAKGKDDKGKKDGKDKGKSGKKEGLAPLPKGAVAKVGSVDLGMDKFHAVYDLKVKKYADRGRKMPKSADRRYRKSITERLIYQEVLRQEADKLGVKYDQEALTKREDQQKKGIRDWERHLARRGESDASLRDMWVRELRERALLDHSGVLTVSDEEVDAEYEKVKENYKKDRDRVRAAHILVRITPPEGKTEKDATDAEKKAWEKAAKAKADDIYKKAKKKGTDFAALAKEHSEGPSAAKGGDLGIFSADRMVKEFSDAAFKLKVGQVSKPVRTKFGFHVIKLLGKFKPGLLPKSALVDQLRSRLEARKLIKSRRELKERLLAAYGVVNHMEPTLGPDPRKRRLEAQKGKGPGAHGHGHGHGGKDAHAGGEKDHKH